MVLDVAELARVSTGSIQCLIAESLGGFSATMKSHWGIRYLLEGGSLNQQQFNELIARVRKGDPSAAEELIKDFEPQIRRLVRLRLSEPRLRRVFDSTDICQSVFANFFFRATIGEFEFDKPEQLLGLLATMARNKLIQRHRRESVRQPRDSAVIFYGDLAGEFQTTVEQPTPSEIVATNELISKFEDRLSPDECQIAKMRREGMTWAEVSETLGKPPDALRKKLSRACDRILEELGLDE